MISFDFITAAFEDDEPSRAQRINEHIGGAALATWLAAHLRVAGFDAATPFAEDHGWDFSIKTASGTYLCACSIDDDQDEDRTAFVTIGKGRAKLPDDDAVAVAVDRILQAHGAITQIGRTRR